MVLQNDHFPADLVSDKWSFSLPRSHNVQSHVHKYKPTKRQLQSTIEFSRQIFLLYTTDYLQHVNKVYGLKLPIKV